jgi:hypothetical protein
LLISKAENPAEVLRGESNRNRRAAVKKVLQAIHLPTPQKRN